MLAAIPSSMLAAILGEAGSWHGFGSGKTYILVGPPDNSPLGDGAWRKWCNDNNTVADRDVTSEYLNVNPEPTLKFKKVGYRSR